MGHTLHHQGLSIDEELRAAREQAEAARREAGKE